MFIEIEVIKKKGCQGILRIKLYKKIFVKQVEITHFQSFICVIWCEKKNLEKNDPRHYHVRNYFWPLRIQQCKKTFYKKVEINIFHDLKKFRKRGRNARSGVGTKKVGVSLQKCSFFPLTFNFGDEAPKRKDFQVKRSVE